MLKQVNPHVGQGFVVCPAINCLPTDDILNTTAADRGCKRSDFAGRMWIGKKAGQLVRAEVVQQPVLVEVELVEELSVNLLVSLLQHMEFRGVGERLLVLRERVHAHLPIQSLIGQALRLLLIRR